MMSAEPRDLLPCPFCGGTARLVQSRNLRDGHMIDYAGVRCTQCMASSGRIEYDATDPMYDTAAACDSAALAWNRRWT